MKRYKFFIISALMALIGLLLMALARAEDQNATFNGIAPDWRQCVSLPQNAACPFDAVTDSVQVPLQTASVDLDGIKKRLQEIPIFGVIEIQGTRTALYGDVVLHVNDFVPLDLVKAKVKVTSIQRSQMEFEIESDTASTRVTVETELAGIIPSQCSTSDYAQTTNTKVFLKPGGAMDLRPMTNASGADSASPK